MESANLHPPQHHLQELFLGYSSSLASSPASTFSTNDCNNPSLILDESTHNTNSTESIPFSREFFQPTVRTFTSAQDFTLQPPLQLQLSRKKDEPLDFFHISNRTTCTPSDVEGFINTPSDDQNQWFNLPGGYQSSELQLLSKELYPNYYHYHPSRFGGFRGLIMGSNRDDYSHVSPSTNGSSILASSLFSSSMGLNLQGNLDHMSSANYFGGISSNSFYDKINVHKENTSSWFGHDFMQESNSIDSPSNSSNKASTDAITKRSTNCSSGSSKESHSEIKKKSSNTKSRPSCPPLKVRKEKLGDRISALQRLVAPFGKTDTASVLTEAIGYIQFLHDQVQTLSVPYMKSSQSKPMLSPKVPIPSPKLYQSSIREDGFERNEDLKKRGLCLVPISCASYVNGFD